jgi:hypothetical protein
MGYGLFALVLLVIFIVLMYLAVSNQTPNEEVSYKRVYLEDFLTGKVFEIELDPMGNPIVPKLDEATGKEFLMRKTGMFDKGEKMMYLENYLKYESPRYIRYMNHVEVVIKQVFTDKKRLESEKLELENTNAEQQARILELETKIDEVLGKRVEFVEKQNIASRKGIPQKPQRSGGSGGDY